ncbi:MAG: IPT/TIG domain-containing protein [Candidatus Sericytochromatia bacterium]|nr:IPT/TIG domain-containing protein [Candidatus Sericytochromatia bacterium]
MIVRSLSVLVALTLAVAGCQGRPASLSLAQTAENGTSTQRQEATLAGPALEGRAIWPDRAGQNTSDILRGATIALVDPDSNYTLSATSLKADGTFSLPVPLGISTSTVYILEGVKGYRQGQPGGEISRLRTLVRYTGSGWASISGNSLILDGLTTAVTQIALLYPADISRAGVLSKVLQTSGGTVLNTNPVLPNHPDSEILLTAQLVRQALSADRDPIAVVDASRISLLSLSATRVTPGDLLAIRGRGFGPTPSSNTVLFGTATASVATVVPGLLHAIVPSDIRGNFQLQVRSALGLSAAIPVFVDGPPPIQLNSIQPPVGLPGQTLTLTGRGFSSTASANEVYFGLVKATPLQASANSLVVKVPSGQLSCNVAVRANGVTSNPFWFEIPYRVTSAPDTGMAGQTITVKGLFPPTKNNSSAVSFNNLDGILQSWTDTEIRVMVPFGVTQGAIAVKFDGVTLTGPTFTPKDGNLGGWSLVNGTYQNYNSYYTGFMGEKALFLRAYSSGYNHYRVRFDDAGAVAGLDVWPSLNNMPYNHYFKGGILLGNWMYWFNDGQNYASVYRAPYDRSNDNLGQFTYYGGMPTAGYNLAVQVDNRVFVYDMVGSWTKVRYATITNDGSLGGWTNESGGWGNYIYGDVIRIGNYLYRFGGSGDPNGCSRAPISNGLVGQFSYYRAMPNYYEGASAAVVGNYVYVISANYNGIWCRARISGQGELGGWENMSGNTAPNPYNHVERLYVKGGYAYYFNYYGLYQAAVLN